MPLSPHWDTVRRSGFDSLCFPETQAYFSLQRILSLTAGRHGVPAHALRALQSLLWVLHRAEWSVALSSCLSMLSCGCHAAQSVSLSDQISGLVFTAGCQLTRAYNLVRVIGSTQSLLNSKSEIPVHLDMSSHDGSCLAPSAE